MRSINKFTKARVDFEAMSLYGQTIDPQDDKWGAKVSQTPQSMRKYLRCERALKKIMEKHWKDYSEESLDKRYRAVYRRYGSDRVNAILSCTAYCSAIKLKAENQESSPLGTIIDEYGKEIPLESWRPSIVKGWENKDKKKEISNFARFDIGLWEKQSKKAQSSVKYLSTMVNRFAAMERANCETSRPCYVNKQRSGKTKLQFMVPSCALKTDKEGRTFLYLPQKGTKSDSEWRIAIDAVPYADYSGTAVVAGNSINAPEGRTCVRIPKGKVLKVFSNGKKQRIKRITAETLASILYHASENDYVPSKKRLTEDEKARFDAATKGEVYGKRTRDLFDGKDKKGNLLKARETFMERLAFIYDGDKKAMAHVFECSGLNNDMDAKERKALAEEACGKVKKHYSDIYAESRASRRRIRDYDEWLASKADELNSK